MFEPGGQTFVRASFARGGLRLCWSPPQTAEMKRAAPARRDPLDSEVVLKPVRSIASPRPTQRGQWQCIYDGREFVAVIELRDSGRWHVIDRHGTDVASYDTRERAIRSLHEP